MSKSIIIDESKRFSKVYQETRKSSKVYDSNITVIVNDTLPFRVKFLPINIPGVSPSNPPPIPLQIIGYSNYIL